MLETSQKVGDKNGDKKPVVTVERVDRPERIERVKAPPAY
jgi:hypothetical protein